MENRDSEILFDYLGKILFSQKAESLDVSQLSEGCRDLGEGLNFVNTKLMEYRRFTSALSKGEFSKTDASRDNSFCWPLKELVSELKHLTWIAKQVAAGDYSQRVDFLGEFSENFNEMIQQLDYRETMLTRERARAEERLVQLNEDNRLMRFVLEKSPDGVLIPSADGEIIYANNSAEEMTRVLGTTTAEFANEYLTGDAEERNVTVSSPDGAEHTVNVHPFRIYWKSRQVTAYILADITGSLRMEQMAMRDALTGVYNRNYFTRKAQSLKDGGQRFVLCFIDIDNLKYVNDHYGHIEGDNYIKSCVELICETFPANDIICRIGGDEFSAISFGLTEKTTKRKMNLARKAFKAQSDQYPRSFSYGVFTVEADSSLEINEMIAEADSRMYAFKRKYKEKPSDA